MQESNNVTNAKQETNTPQETRLIHCYDLLSFVAEIEKAVKDGFSLDFKDNTRCPVVIGYQLITTMVKQEPQEVKLKIEVDTTEVQKVITDTLEGLQSLKEASESTQWDGSSQKVTKEVVDAPKKSGRPAKVK